MQLYDVAAYHIRGMIKALSALGLEVGPLMREANITREALDDPETRFPEPQMMLLWQAAERRYTGTEPFGIALATHIPYGALELIDYLIAACANVSEGIETMARYAALCASGFHYTVDRARLDDEDAIRVRLHHYYGIEMVPPGVLDYLWCAMIYRFREHGDARFRPLVCMRHTPRTHVELYRRVLGWVQFGSEHEELYIPMSQWALENPRRDPMLSSLLARHANDVMERSVPRGDFLDAVRTTIADGMRLGDIGIGRAAGRLGLSTRSLQRKLAEEGCVYKDLVDEVRFELSSRYLTQTKLSLKEIGDLLGFSEQRAFQRAFLRWSNQTPAAYRREHGTSPSLARANAS
jgi:AraC-like DNA-binding protein